MAIIPGERFQTFILTDGISTEYPLSQTYKKEGIFPVLILGTDSVFVEEKPLNRADFFLDLSGDRLVLLKRLPRWSVVRVVFNYIGCPGMKQEGQRLAVKLGSLKEDETLTIVQRIDTAKLPAADEWGISGSKSLGFSLGSDEGIGIEQATRVVLSGKVEDVVVEAELSDQSAPIPPEGTTLELEELDRIIINMRGKGWAGSFGDVEVGTAAGSFGTLKRRATGGVVKGERGIFSLSAGYARPRGKFARASFLGTDGVQGPYPLAPDGRSAQLVPGSEVVYLDGNRLVRGWDADYTIDYSTGELIFTNRHIIGSRSRIEAEFQYLTEAYERSQMVFGLGVQPGPFQFECSFFQEGDNPEKFLEELTTEEKQTLGAIGDDSSRAWLPGAKYVGLGQGDYVREGEYYRFVGTGKGDYQVSFTLKGDSLGSYVYDDTLGGFRYVGVNAGNYIDSVKVPLPQRGEIIYGKTGFELARFTTTLEGAFQRRSLNLFAQNQARRDAGALDFTLGWKDSLVAINYRHRSCGKDFLLPAEVKDVDFAYRWGGAEEMDRQATDEFFTRLTPWQWLELRGELGRLVKFNNNIVNRFGGGCRLGWFWGEFFRVNESNRVKATLSPRVLWVSPKVGWEMELETQKRVRAWDIGGDVKPMESFNGGAEFRVTEYAQPDSERWQLINQSQVLQVNWNWLTKELVRVEGLGGIQRMDFITVNENNWRQFFGTLIARWTPKRGLVFSTAANQSYRQVQLREEQFRYVGKGNGSYRRDSITGGYILDPKGDYERVVVFLGKFTAAKEFSYNGVVEISSFEPMGFSGSFSYERIGSDTALLSEAGRFDLRVDVFALESFVSPVIGFAGDLSVDRTSPMTGKRTTRHQEFIELLTTRILDIEIRNRLEYNAFFRWLSLDEIDYEERGFRFSVTPVIGTRWRLEPGFSIEPKVISQPVSYPELGRFRLVTLESWLANTRVLGEKTKLRAQVGLKYRWASVPYLPWEVGLSQPLGWTPQASFTFEHLFNEIFQASVQYTFEDRPDRSTEHRFSFQLRACF
ncbi:MAG: hypothetical protein ABIK39_05265 [candidate division WOR-3 bacterium]